MPIRTLNGMCKFHSLKNPSVQCMINFGNKLPHSNKDSCCIWHQFNAPSAQVHVFCCFKEYLSDPESQVYS